jgi:hypothetical protein
MDKATQRWTIILLIFIAVYVALWLSQALLGVKVLPW